MLPTIIFFLALSFSWIYLANYLNDSVNEMLGSKQPKEDGFVNALILGIAIILWSWLFYLLH